MPRTSRQRRWRFTPGIFFGSLAIVLIFLVSAIAFTDPFRSGMGAIASVIMTDFGWLYVLGTTSFLIFLIYMAMSRFGHVKLGDDDEEPEFSTPAWFAMLFAAGVGTVLVFWGVAEPVTHFMSPPKSYPDPGGTIANVDEAMTFAMYHFGLHMWALFALPGLAFGYFVYKRKLPPRVSSAFAPLLGHRIYGPIGKTIDSIAIVGTIFGIAVSIGLGTMQFNAGANQLWGLPVNTAVQVLTVAALTTVSCISAALGVSKGVKWLSNINIGLAVALMIFVFLAGPTLFLARGVVEEFGNYVASLPALAFWTDTLRDTGWQNSWTVFYWAWTITWSPFVGLFFAKISRGRTIRQFIGGVLAGPALFCFLWFGIFGLSGIHLILNGDRTLGDLTIDGDIPGALFNFLNHYPAATFISGVTLLIILIFLITSIDSASLVTNEMTVGDGYTTPVYQRVFWGFLTGSVAAALLLAGGEDTLSALQEFIVVVGLPFFIINMVLMASIIKGISEDLGERHRPVTRRWSPARSKESWNRQKDSPAPRPVSPLTHIPEDSPVAEVPVAEVSSDT